MSVNSPQSTNASSNASSARRRRMLVDMGIDVWTSRSFNPEVAQIAVTSDVKIPSVAASDQPSLAEVKARLAEATGAGMSAPKPAALEPLPNQLTLCRKFYKPIESTSTLRKRATRFISASNLLPVQANPLSRICCCLCIGN